MEYYYQSADQLPCNLNAEQVAAFFRLFKSPGIYADALRRISHNPHREENAGV